ncbi:replication-associated recombination protein A (plasmid) [Pontibacillus sp. ALD_SL1]|uniref:replication-associated recombination protein A n=1 Tax=Pontibacillus sp. ALD_SL1 TaxID=2777185 RepID=UPI001A972436|nr:replication-associated recombination protein A [Pontibacillus sp. ALD_SL1]QST02862.1 replication-associated recombination protein A [Pontibacillus sp. ALD_SL1]
MIPMPQPLAYRMRPTHIDHLIGQSHIIGKGTALYHMISKGHVPSLLLYGEPGIGKTSIASAIAGTIDAPFVLLNATTTGKKDIERAVKEAEKTEGPFILAVDEVHRFTKVQQDALLPHLESGLITLIAMTTENPYHSVVPAIRSRCSMIKQLKRLTEIDVTEALKRALTDREKGVGEMDLKISDEVLSKIASGTNGDVRSSLNVLEAASFASVDGEIQEKTIHEFLKGKGFSHDRDGDGHYNVLSAFQKSIRGSDVDASLHYLARLIQAGDDTSIIRRLKVIAFEDIGIASKETVSFVCHACDSVRELGFPEARIPLANAVVSLCLAPKSNSSYVALDHALADVENGNVGEIPMHLRDAHYASAKKLGHGEGYRYPHDSQVGSFGGWVRQDYLPETLSNRQYYHPKKAGDEAKMAAIHEKLKGAQHGRNG